jgi:sugar/nucleoside kinase (ribokinase family)
MKRIHCVGIVVVDLLNGPIHHYPVPKSATQITAEWARILPGGGAANTASAIGRMGLPVAAFCKVGADLNGEFVRREMEKAGVDVSGFIVSEQEGTPFTFVGVHADSERTFIHTPGANLTFKPEDLNLDRVLATDFLLYNDLWVLPAFDGPPAAALLAEAQRRGVLTFLDECYGYGPKRELLEVMLPHCDYFTPSYDDLMAVYPGLSPEALATELLARGAKTVVIKTGREGCLVARGRERHRIPITPARPVDTTGAGDCWNAGFMAALAHGEDVLRAARVGNACAAFGIEAVGGSAGVPAYAEVCRRADLID